MIHSCTNAIYGWKLTGEIVSEFCNELEKWDKDYIDKIEDIAVIDYMSGDYVYIGALLGKWNEDDDGGEIIVNDEIVKTATDEFNKFIKINVEFDNILKEFINHQKPQLYIMQQKY